MFPGKPPLQDWELDTWLGQSKTQPLTTICWASRLSWIRLDDFESGKVEGLGVEVDKYRGCF